MLSGNMPFFVIIILMGSAGSCTCLVTILVAVTHVAWKDLHLRPEFIVLIVLAIVLCLCA